MCVGKLTGKVEHESAKGFAVRTPSATVTDLGTEFGVEADRRGDTTTHVFRGSVQLQATTGNGNAEGPLLVLRKNQSARVQKSNNPAGNRIDILETSANQPGFVRAIPEQKIKTFDLVDVVAGGDGFSGKRNASINPTNGGRSTEVFIRKVHTGESPLFHVAGDDVWGRRRWKGSSYRGVAICRWSVHSRRKQRAGHGRLRRPHICGMSERP